MLFLRQPGPRQIEALRNALRLAPYSYGHVGATRTSPPPGWRINQRREHVGSGREDHARAVAALFSWRLLHLPGLAVYPSAPAVAPGETVALVSRHLGIWSLDVARIIDCFRELPSPDGSRISTGFTYGTLPGHAMSGEERFSVELHPASGEVFYEIFSFSRPANWRVRLAAPLARAAQKRFTLDSMENAARLARGQG